MTGVTGGSDEGRCVPLGTLYLDLGVPEMQGQTQQCVPRTVAHQWWATATAPVTTTR